MKARLPLARRFVTSSDCCCNTGLRIAELSTETVVYCCLNTESWSQSFQCNTNLSCAELMDPYHILLWALNLNFENKFFALMWKWMNQSEHNFARANFWPDWPIRIKIRAKEHSPDLNYELSNHLSKGLQKTGYFIQASNCPCLVNFKNDIKWVFLYESIQNMKRWGIICSLHNSHQPMSKAFNKKSWPLSTVHPMNYAHRFVLCCFVWLYLQHLAD